VSLVRGIRLVREEGAAVAQAAFKGHQIRAQQDFMTKEILLRLLRVTKRIL